MAKARVSPRPQPEHAPGAREPPCGGSPHAKALGGSGGGSVRVRAPRRPPPLFPRQISPPTRSDNDHARRALRRIDGAPRRRLLVPPAVKGHFDGRRRLPRGGSPPPPPPRAPPAAAIGSATLRRQAGLAGHAATMGEPMWKKPKKGQSWGGVRHHRRSRRSVASASLLPPDCCSCAAQRALPLPPMTAAATVGARPRYIPTDTIHRVLASAPTPGEGKVGGSQGEYGGGRLDGWRSGGHPWGQRGEPAGRNTPWVGERSDLVAVSAAVAFAGKGTAHTARRRRVAAAVGAPWVGVDATLRSS